MVFCPVVGGRSLSQDGVSGLYVASHSGRGQSRLLHKVAASLEEPENRTLSLLEALAWTWHCVILPYSIGQDKL